MRPSSMGVKNNNNISSSNSQAQFKKFKNLKLKKTQISEFPVKPPGVLLHQNRALKSSLHVIKCGAFGE